MLASLGAGVSDLDHKIIALTEVIMHFQPHVITCWVSEKEYAETIRVSGPPDLQHAYLLCFMGSVIKVAEYQRHMGVDTPVDYVFDEKGDMGYEAAMWYPAMKDSLPQETKSRMGSTPIFRDDNKILPLQAADLIAWNRRREKEFPGFDLERAASMRLDELNGAEIYFGQSELELLAGRVQAVPGIEHARGGTSHYKQLKRAHRKAIRRQASGYKPEQH